MLIQEFNGKNQQCEWPGQVKVQYKGFILLPEQSAPWQYQVLGVDPEWHSGINKSAKHVIFVWMHNWLRVEKWESGTSHLGRDH